jgi:TctA family transporter
LRRLRAYRAPAHEREVETLECRFGLRAARVGVTFADVLSSAVTIFVDPTLLGMMAVGISMGMVFGAVPGLSAKMGILLLMPLLFGMDPAVGVVLLLSMHSVVHTGGSIPSILFGVPGGAAEAATVLDGYQMAKNGAAGEALGASMAASAIGGVLGAVAYFVLLPGFAAIGKLFGAPEYLLLAIIGLTAVGTLSHSSPLKGLAMGALGLLAGSVGMDRASGTPRFTFGLLEMWDGIDTLMVVTGFFAIPELIDLARLDSRRARGPEAAGGCTYRAMFRGMAATWTHRWLALRTTAIGIAIGIMPGLGAEIASWLSYGHAVQTSSDKSRFGTGAIEGVIAPETANNSKEGGGFLPTVAFGIPGTSAMAMVIAAFSILGVQVGPTMLQIHGDLIALIGWTILWSNMLAVALFLAVLPVVGRMVLLRIEVIAPVVIAFAIVGALIEHSSWWSVSMLLALSLLGCAFAAFDWPRAPFLLGFIMGPLAEINLVKTVAIYDWSVLQRWPTLALLASLAVLLWRAFHVRKGAWRSVITGSDRVFAGLVCFTFIAAAIATLDYRIEARLLPLCAAVAGAALTAVLALGSARGRSPSSTEGAGPWRPLLVLVGLVALIPALGILPAAAIYTGLHCHVVLRFDLLRASFMAALVAALVWGFFGLWLRQPVFATAF